MSIHKTQNPILVIATLGVYFGLILAGATPQVLANAAMTRQFDVKDEIEIKDDLDTKPDDERSPVTASVQIYFEDVEYFLASLGKLKNSNKFDLDRDSFSVAKNSLLPCVDTNRAGRYAPIRFESSNEASRYALDYFSRGMEYGYSLGDCIATNEFDVTAADSRFAFSLDKKLFAVNVTVKKDSPARALELVRQLETTLKLYSNQPTNSKLRQAVIRNTTFKAQNDQVFVVTRLPRAGLITLLSSVSVART
ncbi:MAG: hypothetical protein ABL999_15110 [Pyrinomonadaceae bacterium]